MTPKHQSVVAESQITFSATPPATVTLPISPPPSAMKCLPLVFSLCISLPLTSVSLSLSLYLVFSFWDVNKHRLFLFWVLEKKKHLDNL